MRQAAARAVVLVVLWAAPVTAQCVPPPEVHFTALPNFVVDIGEGVYDGPGLQSFALADVNADGRLDLLTIEADEDRVAVRLGRLDASGTFEDAVPVDTDVSDPTVVAVADVASPFASEDVGAPDGKPDLIVGGLFDLDIHLGRGDGQFDPPEQEIDDTFDLAWVVGVVAHDLDGQAGIDLAVLDEDGFVTPMCNNAGNLQPCDVLPIELEDYSEPVDIVAGDFDGDGHSDLAVLDRDESVVTPLYGHGDGTFDAASAIPVRGEGDESRDLAVGRIDADALDDLVVVNHGEFGEFLGVLLRGRGTGGFRQELFVAQLGATSLALADFNGEPDGALDVIAGSSTFSPSLNLNDGFGTLQDPIGPVATSPIGAIAAGDLGGDGRADFIILDSLGVTMQVVLNDLVPRTPECAGDCDCSGAVSVNELVLAVGIALSAPAQISCREADLDASGKLTINELIAAVRSALDGCPA
ncbi:MAG: FG-GAP repeat domain-containing protein [Candidatus Binatia bacterium]